MGSFSQHTWRHFQKHANLFLPGPLARTQQPLAFYDAACDRMLIHAKWGLFGVSVDVTKFVAMLHINVDWSHLHGVSLHTHSALNIRDSCKCNRCTSLHQSDFSHEL